MSTVSVPTSPETPRSAVSSLILGHVAAPPHEEVTKATQILSKMKDALDPLNVRLL
jgi:hypothetical protein